MNPIFLEHASADPHGEQLAALRDAIIANNLRTLELMFLDIHAALHSDPSIGTVWFELDSGDPDSYPVLSCKTMEGLDVEEEPEILETITDRWNETTHPMVAAFLEKNNWHNFHRESFPKDVKKACQNMQTSCLIPLERDDFTLWLGSFISHLRGMELDQSLEGSHKGPKPRM